MQKLTGVIPGDAVFTGVTPVIQKLTRVLAADNLSFIMRDDEKSTFYDGGWREIVFVTRPFGSKIKVEKYWL